MKRLHGPVLLLLLLLVFGLGWLAGHSSRTSPSPGPERVRDGSDDTVPRLPDGDSGPATGSRDAGARGASGSGDTEPGPSSGPLDPTGVVAWVDGSIDGPRGWGPGTIYLLPEGAPGTEVDGTPSLRAWPSSKRTFRLPVPRAGRWDVGFRVPWGWILKEGVEVEEGEAKAVTLRANGTRPVQIRLRDPLPPGTVGKLTLDFAEGATQAALPGRGEIPYLHYDSALSSPGLTTPPLPEDIPFVVSTWAENVVRQGRPQAPPTVVLVPRPRVVRAGEVVEVEVREKATLRLRIRTDVPYPASWSRSGYDFRPSVIFHFDTEDGDVGARHVRLDDRALEPAGQVVEFLAPPGRGRLSWGSISVFKDAIDDLHLKPGRVFEHDVVVRLRTSLDPFSADPDEPEPASVLVRVSGERTGPDAAEISLVSRDSTGSGSGEFIDPGAAAELHTLDPSDPEPIWVLVTQGLDRAAEPILASPGALAEVRLVPAGWLMVAPDFVWAKWLGRLTLRRPGGMPIPTAGSAGSGEVPAVGWGGIGEDLVVTPGTLIGPLPAGTHTFEVRLGAVRLSDASATVRAGRVVPLPVRRE